MSTSTEIRELDVSRRRGTYVVQTEGWRYIIEADKRPGGFVRMFTDNTHFPGLYEGCVGLDGRRPTDHNDPIIRVGERMIVSQRIGANPLITSTVTSISAAEDGVTIDSLICPRCSRGFKEGDKPCRLCRH